jgi:hypothetical protein
LAGITSDSQAAPARRRADVSPQRQPEAVRAALPREVAAEVPAALPPEAVEAVDAPRPVEAAERPAQRVAVVARPARRVAAAVRHVQQVEAAAQRARQVAAARRVPRAEEQDALRPVAVVHARRPAVRASRSREPAKLWRTAAAR